MILPVNISKKDLLDIAAHGESYSNHPIAASILDAHRNEGLSINKERISEATEEAGHGIIVKIDGKTVLLGNEKLLKKYDIKYDACAENGTIVYVAIDGEYAGAVVISDTIKAGAKDALTAMKKAGVSRVVMLTGDRKKAADGVAAELNLDMVCSELLPGDKVSKVEELLASKEVGSYLAFVGDGINDAPVLTRADIGIAMGSMGSDAAIEAADIVLMDDDINKIPAIIRIARKTLIIVRQNIVFALSVKLLVLLLSALGIVNMWAAVFADVGVAVLAILNSMRALKSK